MNDAEQKFHELAVQTTEEAAALLGVSTERFEQMCEEIVEGEVLPPDTFFWESTVTPAPSWWIPDKNVTPE